jgi:hypothetical protein
VKQEIKAKIEAEMLAVGTKAVLKAPKAKLVAKVNSRDNFALYFRRDADSAMMDVVCKRLDNPKTKGTYGDWFNDACKTKQTQRRILENEFDCIAFRAAEAAYDKLKS